MYSPILRAKTCMLRRVNGDLAGISDFSDAIHFFDMFFQYQICGIDSDIWVDMWPKFFGQFGQCGMRILWHKHQNDGTSEGLFFFKKKSRVASRKFPVMVLNYSRVNRLNLAGAPAAGACTAAASAGFWPLTWIWCHLRAGTSACRLDDMIQQWGSRPYSSLERWILI